MLSTTTIVQLTHAVPVLVYRHPAAVLASYRRMRWSPDVSEVQDIVPRQMQPDFEVSPTRGSETHAMAWFWATLNAVALDDLRHTPASVVVSHEDLASGGGEALQQLFQACGLKTVGSAEADAGRARRSQSQISSGTEALHRLERPPSEVANAWREGVDLGEVRELENLIAPTLGELERRKLRFEL